MKTALIAIAACVLSVGMVLAALRICPACGYEAAAADATCTHCGKALPAVVAREEAPPQAGLRTRIAGSVVVPGQAVIEEGRMAMQYRQEGQPDLALLFARNAAALELLTADAAGNDRAARLAEIIEECKVAARVLTRRCKICEGTGRVVHQIALSEGLGGEQEPVRRRTCETCGGKGYEAVEGTVSEQMQARGKALRSYEVLQRGRKYVNIGNAWAPPEVAEALDVKQKATLLCATASPCAECQGFNWLDCEACAGTGAQRCRARGCDKGWVTEEREGRLIKDSYRVRERCTACDGRGFLNCDKCGGRGRLLCDECQGRGERALCTRCNGQGFSPCLRCKGSGDYRGQPCPECGGGGVGLCRTCGGDGRKR